MAAWSIRSCVDQFASFELSDLQVQLLQQKRSLNPDDIRLSF
ncbi:MAG TPA: hypothetical protein VN457_05505 [Chlamydiales bacterium]|nr:hypothetical protein [Chlamydiales bacterium]